MCRCVGMQWLWVGVCIKVNHANTHYTHMYSQTGGEAIMECLPSHHFHCYGSLWWALWSTVQPHQHQDHRIQNEILA